MIDKDGCTKQTIFNEDETGFFWKQMSKRTTVASEEKTSPGNKAVKGWLAVTVG